MKRNQRKIMVLTGKRGGYGAMKPMLKILNKDIDVDLQLVVTDQHISNKFGMTINEIKNDSIKITAEIDMMQENDSPSSRSCALGRFLIGITHTLEDLTPDILVLYGDRGEVLIAAVAATTMNIPIAHIQGGDVTGSVDEQMRHAVTKLAQMHFPSTKESAMRIEKFGEDPWRVNIVGDSHIDEIFARNFLNPNQVLSKLSINLLLPIIVVLQHSETTNPDASYTQMIETLAAVSSIDAQVIVVHPCSDVGYEGIIEAIAEYQDKPNFKVFVNLDAPIFWGLLNIASVLVGNSSSGIIETPIFKLPTINIGRRQKGRMYAENVIHVAHDQEKIKQALHMTIYDEMFISTATKCSQLYGNGTAGIKIANILKHIEIDKNLMEKINKY
jgi:UDP-hydrolysing UDP-N-acetyl-D-glucosamine 2-epimerase